MGKLCEIVVKANEVEYLEENEVIKSNLYQFRFRKVRPCIPNLPSFYIRAIDKVHGRKGCVDTGI